MTATLPNTPHTSVAPKVQPAPVAPGRDIESRLRQLWRLYTARLVTRGAGWLVAALIGAIFCDLLLDWNLDLAGGWRLVLLALNLALLAYIVYRCIVRLYSQFDLVGEALRVERARPELNGLLVSYVQFSDEAAYPPSVSRELMRAVRQLADQRLATLEFRAVARRVALRAALLAAAGTLVALVMFAAWRGEHLMTLARRMVNPASQEQYPTQTQVEALTGDITLRSGGPVTLLARAKGVIPSDGMVRVRFGALTWETLPAVATSMPGEFKYEMPRVTENVEYYFRMGDGRSARHRVQVVRAPCVARARVELTYPGYTKLTPQEVETLNLKVPEGTQVNWKVTFSEPVVGAQLLVDGADPAPLQLSANASEGTIQMPASASRAYQIALRWKLGQQEHVEPGPRYYLQVVPDADPQVTLVQPSEDGKATLKKVIHLAFNARDDYALGEATVVFSVNDSAELRHPLGRLSDAAQMDKQIAWPVTQQFPGLKVGDMLTFAVEVTDNRPGQPGKTRSLSRRVQFVTDSDYLSFVLARQRKALSQLRPIYLQQKDAAKELEKVGGSNP